MPKDIPIGTREDGSPIFDNTASVVVVAVKNDLGHYLVVKRATGMGTGLWAFPGGFQMNGQTWRDAAIAEVMEETGVAVKNASLLFMYIDYGELTPHNLFMVQCELDSQTDNPTDGEVSEHRWIDLANKDRFDWAFPTHMKYAEYLAG